MNLENKKILVTGGAGFVGSNLCKALVLFKNIKVCSLDNYFTGKKENHIQGVEYFEGNTWDANVIFKNLKEEEYFDIVFHFGEYSRIVKSFDDIQFVQRSILSGTPVILDPVPINDCACILPETIKESSKPPTSVGAVPII